MMLPPEIELIVREARSQQMEFAKQYYHREIEKIKSHHASQVKVLKEALENIKSITKKQFEENPMYWMSMAVGAAVEALSQLKESK